MNNSVFYDVSKVIVDFLIKAELPTEALPIRDLDQVRVKINNGMEDARTELARVKFLNKINFVNGSPVGLNTVGLLLDRLSILIIRHVKTTRSFSFDQDKKILEIVSALDFSQPGNSSINTKITTLKSGVVVSNFPEALLLLVCTNTLLWEAQEVLYTRGVAALPDFELRDYIEFFSVENVNRNELIQASDSLFWKMLNEK